MHRCHRGKGRVSHSLKPDMNLVVCVYVCGLAIVHVCGG